MLKLRTNCLNDNKFAVFLDHRKLIDESYGDFRLRPELFQFQVKKQTQEDGEKRSRKRKRKAGEEDISTSKDLQLINGYLDLLPKPQAADDPPPIGRHWEDPYSLPQLHGGNESGRVQRFQCPNDTGRVYLIPDRARFYNHNVDQLPALLPQLLPAYDLIVLDPPWRNKYIRRLKRAKQELGYAMLYNDQLSLIPISQLTHPLSLVAIWCTNSAQHQTALEQQLLPSWHLRLLHKLRWYKLSSEHQLIAPPQADATQKQPYEMLYVTCHADAPEDYCVELRNTEMLLSVPSIVHSHKPPLLAWLREHLQSKEPNCLELFARYLQPQFTSVGLEVLKLMDERLYELSTDGSKNT
ncbi:hypothetical protein KR054_008077 [Drosophila jambulina]|nr:hypothetical protein KR054_008077 [Drosophila jambulina]